MVDYTIAKGIATIVLTSSFDNDTREQVLSKKIIDYIVKRDITDLDYLETVVRRVLHNRTVKGLVVDDSLVYRESMAQLLRSQLLTVFTASNGVEAINVINQHPDIKIVITDYTMPKMDGLQLVSQLRSHYKKDSMAIIIASGLGGASVIPRFLKAGANDYLLKPYSTEEFICRINANLENLHMIQTLKDLAQTDPLTGLYNRRYLFEAGVSLLASAVRSKFRVYTALFDIDHFKKINDTYGHDAGDLVIRAVSYKLKEFFRRKTDIVARFGGEEFCVISPLENEKNIYTFLECVKASIQKMVLPYGRHKISVTVSIGATTIQTGNFEQMLKRADEMLYRAKKSGRNQVCIDMAEQ
jgi:diguanylate cyclase (GGDEF)-like protein